MTEGGHHPSVTDLALPAANTIVFLFGMVYLLRGPLREYFRDRAHTIRKALEAGKKAREEAAALKAQLERDLADMPRIREELKAELKDTAERQRDRTIETAQRAAARIREEAQTLAAQEQAAARRELRGEVVERAVAEATSLARAALGPDDQQRFVREFSEGARQQ